jgi:aconitate hydratase
MITVSNHSVVYANGAFRPATDADKAAGQSKTMAYGIFARHNTSGNMASLQLKVDAMASHDITYVGIIQTARASGLEQFPLPYVLTNCHNSLCAVGGTINEDDHVFGLSPPRSTAASSSPPTRPSSTPICASAMPAAAR